jgi:hypothetical protein
MMKYSSGLLTLAKWEPGEVCDNAHCLCGQYEKSLHATLRDNISGKTTLYRDLIRNALESIN